MMKKPFGLTFGLGILGLILAGVLLYKFWIITLNLIGGFLLYVLLDKCIDKLERKGIKGILAYTILGLFFSAAVLSSVLFVAIPLGEQLHAFAGQLPRITQHLDALETSMPFLLTALDELKENIVRSLTRFFSHATSLVTSAATILLMAIILLASRRTLWQTIVERVPNDYFEVFVSIAHRIAHHVQNYMAAKSLETAIMIIIHAAGFWIIGFPLPLLFALMAGFLNLIPYIGVLFTAIPVGLVALTTDGYQLLGLAMLVLLVARLVDDFLLQTWLVSHFVDIHPFTTVVVILVAEAFMGIIGMVIAIPAYVIAKIIITGLYEYLRSVQRHESILQEEEEHKKKHDAGEHQHQVQSHIV